MIRGLTLKDYFQRARPFDKDTGPPACCSEHQQSQPRKSTNQSWIRQGQFTHSLGSIFPFLHLFSPLRTGLRIRPLPPGPGLMSLAGLRKELPLPRMAQLAGGMKEVLSEVCTVKIHLQIKSFHLTVFAFWNARWKRWKFLTLSPCKSALSGFNHCRCYCLCIRACSY